MNEKRSSEMEAIETTGNTSVAAGTLASMPQWILPALAQGEELVLFTDMPEDYSRPPARPGAPHWLDTRMISDFYTDNQDFYVVQHYGQPEIDLSDYTLKVTGLVDREMEYSLSDLQDMNQVDIDAGFECGGNNTGRFQGLIGNANWKGVRLQDLLNASGVKSEGTEVVFLGADSGPEEIPDRRSGL